MAFDVRLTLLEMQQGALVGIARDHDAASNKAQSVPTMDHKSKLYNSIVGAMGEIALAKALDRFFPSSINNYKGADIGHNIQARTRQRHDYDLNIRDEDNPDHVYFLLTCEEPPLFIVRGWIIGRNARRDEWRKDHGGYGKPAWFVPQSALRQDGFGKREEAA